jgi:hypothetical protein
MILGRVRWRLSRRDGSIPEADAGRERPPLSPIPTIRTKSVYPLDFRLNKELK